MLSLASPWPTLNEPVLSLSCIIMNIHLSVCENLCVCVCDALAGMKEAITIYLNHNPSLCLNNKSSWQQFYLSPQPNKTSFVLGAKEEPSLFSVMLLFYFKEQSGQSGLSYWLPYNSLFTHIHTCFTLPLSLILDESSGLTEEGKAWVPFVPPGEEKYWLQHCLEYLWHSEMMFLHTQGPFPNATKHNLDFMQMCTSHRGC